jgi:hypothetical protein
MDKTLSRVTGRLYQSCRIAARALRGVKAQITSALVFALLILAIALAPIGNGQAVNGSASHQVIHHSAIVLADDDLPTPTELSRPSCLGTPTPTPTGIGQIPPCDPGGGAGGGSGDPHGG